MSPTDSILEDALIKILKNYNKMFKGKHDKLSKKEEKTHVEMYDAIEGLAGLLQDSEKLVDALRKVNEESRSMLSDPLEPIMNYDELMDL